MDGITKNTHARTVLCAAYCFVCLQSSKPLALGTVCNADVFGRFEKGTPLSKLDLGLKTESFVQREAVQNHIGGSVQSKRASAAL